jgi:hypothetical protein
LTHLKLCTFALLFLFPPAVAASPGRLPACNDDHPRIGRILVTRAPITVTRYNRTYAISVDTSLCVNDRVTTGEGQADVIVNKSRRTLPRATSFDARPPQESSGLFAFLGREFVTNFTSLVRTARERVTSMQGSEEARFTLAGLRDGKARIGAGRRPLELRFLGAGDGFAARLIGPDGRIVNGQITDEPSDRPWRALFPETTFQAGETWRISIGNDIGGVEGHFTVVEGPVLPPALGSGLTDNDRIVIGALALAASDVDRWSLEAFQWISGRRTRRFGSVDAEYLLWQWSTDRWAAPRPRKEQAE